MPINYELMKQEHPKLKAALTRAQKKGYAEVLTACAFAISRWEVWGCWPDNWSNWQRALVDASTKHWRLTGEFVNAPRLEDL